MNKTKILIVEDEAIVAEDLSGKLKQLGYEVVAVVAGGEEAVELAGRLRPHLILMDIRLEGPLDGIEAAEEIHRQQDVPVIYLTAHSDSSTLDRAKLTGPFGYILKPFEERELATQIELALYKHQVDLQLRQQREWLRVTLTSIGDAVVSTDADGRINFINPVAESLTGWEAGQAVGLPVTWVFRVANAQTGRTLEEPVARVLREGRIVPLTNHAVLLTRDGRQVPIEDTAAPILDTAGQVIGAVLVFHDVTEKRRAQEELRRSRDELELRVQERTAELERKNLELQDFAFVASHDLQEPLRKVSTFGDRLKKKYGPALGDVGMDYLDRMLLATTRMRSLLNSLLEYSRITTKTEPFRQVDLDSIIREVLSDLEVRLEKTGGKVEVGELPVIFADPTQMRQLFQNLIGNGLKFHQEGKSPIIKVQAASDGNGNLRVVIEDNGIGFDQEYADKIFTPFQRLHGRNEYDGAGMGLAICKKIVERHGGTIAARGTPGHGSSFIVTLPAGPKGGAQGT